MGWGPSPGPAVSCTLGNEKANVPPLVMLTASITGQRAFKPDAMRSLFTFTYAIVLSRPAPWPATPSTYVEASSSHGPAHPLHSAIAETLPTHHATSFEAFGRSRSFPLRLL